MHPIEKIVQAILNYFNEFDLNITKRDKTLPIVYWLLEMRKASVGARFIKASKTCSIKLLSDIIS